jgi:lipopolysaccharide biosynthesis glycosyltransferase
LDSDLIVGADVNELFQSDLENQALGVVFDGCVRNALESAFLLGLGLSTDAPYFNAGVLLLNAAAWRNEQLTQKCLEFCGRHARQLVNADQQVLNSVFHQRVLSLDKRFNVPLYPTTARWSSGRAGNQIIHFVGSPKPWDLFGPHCHGNHPLFETQLKRTALGDRIRFRPQTFYRAFKLVRSYHQCLSARRKPSNHDKPYVERKESGGPLFH